MARNDDYKIGYGRPPIHTQFPKGKSGNPSGKRAPDPSMTELLLAELNKTVLITENGKTRRITKRQAVAMKLVQKAMQGDPRAQKQVMEAMPVTDQFSYPDGSTIEFTLKLEDDDREMGGPLK